MIRRFIISLMTGTLLAACVPLGTPPSSAPTETFYRSREMLLRGTTGARALPAAIATRTYTLTCNQLPVEPTPWLRADRSLSYIAQTEGPVGDQMIGMRAAEAGEAKRVNPRISEVHRCRVTGTRTTLVTTDPSQVLQFVTRNNLMSHLKRKQ